MRTQVKNLKRMMLVTLVVAFLGCAPVVRDKLTCQAVPILYAKKDGGGKQRELGRGRISDLRQIRFNNKASSIKIPNGWSVTLYNKKNFEGYGHEIHVLGTSKLGCRIFNLKDIPLHPDARTKTWNNKASSLSVIFLPQ